MQGNERVVMRVGGKLTYLQGSGMLPGRADAQPEDGTIEAVGMVAESIFLAEKGIAKSLDGHLTCFRKRRKGQRYWHTVG